MSAAEFNMDANLTVEQKLDRVCQVILSCGLGVRGGEMAFGGNCVRVKNAVNQISDELLDRVYDNHPTRARLLADTVRLAKDIFNNPDSERLKLVSLVQAFLNLNRDGWNALTKPVVWDKAQAKPNTTAARFMNAFAIAENKGPSVGQRPAISHPTPHHGIMESRGHQPR